MVSIDINWSVLIQMINFIVLMAALNYLLFKPIRGIIKKRAEKVAGLNGEITADTENAASKSTELEDRRRQARSQGAEAKEELKAEGRARERELIEAATAEMEKTVAGVREQIADDIGQAREELKSQVQTFGQDLAQKILGRSIQ